MKNFFTTEWERISNMSAVERNSLLCNLCVKEIQKTIMPHEIVQLEIIQAIRTANGEIAAVLKTWEEHPELDPRK